MQKIPECEICDFENALKRGRATWVCPDCGRDFSMEYLFWYQATHPELDEEPIKKLPDQHE